MPEQTFEVIATVSPRSVGPRSLFDAESVITARTVAEFTSTPGDVRDAKRVLAEAGFHVFEEGSSDKTISIGGTATLFQEFFGARLAEKSVPVGPERTASYLGTADDPDEAVLTPPPAYAALIEGAVIARPPIYFAASAIPPVAPIHAAAYQYLTVPDGVAVMLRAARVHRFGVTGRQVVVGMIDTGHFQHPFFTHHGYAVLPTLLAPGASDPANDSNGHGTGESANIFACAPDCRLLPIKMANDTVGAINVALNATPRPQILTNSWGYDVDDPGSSIPNWLKPLEAAVAGAVAQGVVVCFSAGNGQRGFPGSHPDVISVGGVHVNLPDVDDLEASSYASSFNSSWYPGRASPDVCGLTGKAVNVNGTKAPSLLLPVQEGAMLDTIDPPTGPAADGWGLFSGTSAACPQVAGVVALLLERDPTLTPAQVRDALKASARDIQQGTTRHGETAVAGPDLATGAGLVDAQWAHVGLAHVEPTFFAAPKEQQLAMLATSSVPRGLVQDLIDELNAR